jgi:four helix bundle protein
MATKKFTKKSLRTGKLNEEWIIRKEELANMNPRDYGNKGIVKRSFKFSISIINSVRLLPRDMAGASIGRQLFRSGTSVGANIHEAQYASTKKEFTRKMQIALSELNETIYWLELVNKAGILPCDRLQSELLEAFELRKVLATIIIKCKQR